MSRRRVVVTIDEVIVDGVPGAVASTALIQRALEQEVRRLVTAQPIATWQPRSVDRVEAAPMAMPTGAPVHELTNALAQRIVASVAIDRAPVSGRSR